MPRRGGRTLLGDRRRLRAIRAGRAAALLRWAEPRAVLPENGKWRLQTRVSNRALPITPAERLHALARPDLVPYDPSQPLPQIENLPDLIPIQFNGKLYLKQTQPVPDELRSVFELIYQELTGGFAT